jgi:hypothetical protein
MNKYIVSVEKRDTKGNYTANKRVNVEANSESEAKEKAIKKVPGGIKAYRVNKM